MGWLEFITKCLDAIAWPIAFIVAILFFRKPLIDLIPSTEEAEGFGFKLKFDKTLKNAAKSIDMLPPSGASVSLPPFTGHATGQTVVTKSYTTDSVDSIEYDDTRLDQTADEVTSAFPSPDSVTLRINPAAVILEIWKDLESGARSILLSQGHHTLPGFRSDPFARLQKDGLITEAEMESVNELRKLRNLAAHARPFEITAADALQFKDLVDTMILRWQFKEAWKKTVGAGDK